MVSLFVLLYNCSTSRTSFLIAKGIDMTSLPPNILQVKAMALSSAGVIVRDRAFLASCCFKVLVYLWRYLCAFVVHCMVQEDKMNIGLHKETRHLLALCLCEAI